MIFTSTHVQIVIVSYYTTTAATAIEEENNTTSRDPANDVIVSSGDMNASPSSEFTAISNGGHVVNNRVTYQATNTTALFEASLRDYLRRALPSYMQPKLFKVRHIPLQVG